MKTEVNIMKPELANLFTFNTTGQKNDVNLSFFYEWRDTEDGLTTAVKKQKVASVLLSEDDAIQLIDALNTFKLKMSEVKSNG